jgi:two-component system sensor histidine kinase UhpB
MDITERKLAEQELLESRALLLDAQKLAQVGCCHYNVLDRRMIWSEELYRIHGVDPDAFLPTHDSTMQLVHPEDRAAWQDTLAHALHDGKPFTREFRIVRRDASVRHLRSLGEVIKDAAGRPARMLWSVLDITEQKQTEHALRTSAEQLTALSRRLVEVQEAERRQLSRELHDRVGQNLTALSINLDILRTGLSGDECAEHRLRLSDSTALLESTVDTIEDVMAELRPPMLDDYGLLPALHWYARDFSKRTGIEVDVDGKDVERPAPELEITLFRIAQEALNNVAKHARAKWVQIELDHVNGHSVMTVTDNGIGIDGAHRERTGLGMVTMRERTQAVGGIFRVRRGPGGGTQIAVEISRHGNTHTHRG